jgi:lactate racemase
MKTVQLPYGRSPVVLRLPDHTAVLHGQPAAAVADPAAAVRDSLARPLGCAPLRELLAARQPRTVAITVADSTRPVPHGEFLPILLHTLHDAGIDADRIVIVIGTGMHRPSTAAERTASLGAEVLQRIEVIDHDAHDPSTLVRVSDDPPVAVCRRFAAADFRIVTGLIEPHFMAGFSGGPKGVCPALVDLHTVQRFHGFDTLADLRSDTGILAGNPCHAIALHIARAVGVDFLLNVSLSAGRRMAGVYGGDLEQAHAAGCRDVEAWNTARIANPFDLVITSGGGFPLDQSFYQSVKGICAALPALHSASTLLQLAHCGDGLGSAAYTQMLQHWGHDWRGFLAHLAAHAARTELDQWELQMQCRVLERIGIEGLWFASDGVPADVQQRIAVTPLRGEGDAVSRAQQAIECYVEAHPAARIAVIPDGPYTMLQRA